MKTPTTVITLGNGQLGLMLSKAAKSLGISFDALSLDEAWEWAKAGHTENVLVTFEQEHVDEKLLAALKQMAIPSFPTWDSFFLLRSKLSQKEFLKKFHFPSAEYQNATPWTDELQKFANGAVLKAGKGGYDGNGVWLIDSKGQTKQGAAKDIAAKIQEPYVEKRVPFQYELASVVCRSRSGKMEVYPSVKSIQRNGIRYQVEYTEEFAASKTAQKAGEIAKSIAEKLNYIGVLAVEFFAVGDDIFVNEIAPRVHNSGHFTIDVCAGSQFENHLRAGLDLPLLSAQPTHPAALMVNLLWPETEKEFAPLFSKLTCGPQWPDNVKLHWYGKSTIRAQRKMGHFTVYGKSIQECRAMADQILASRWA